MKSLAPAFGRSFALALALGMMLPSFGDAAAIVEAARGAVPPIGTYGAASRDGGFSVPTITADRLTSLAPLASSVSGPAELAAPLAFSAPTGAQAAVRFDRIEAAQVAAIAQSLPAGIAREVFVSFAQTLGDAERGARFFDSSRAHGASSDDAVPAASKEPGLAGVSAKAARLHKNYEKAAEKRFADFKATVGQVRSGRFGIDIIWNFSNSQIRYVVAYRLGDKAFTRAQIDEAVAANIIPSAEWESAQKDLDAAVPKLIQHLVSVMEQNALEHQAVHQKMDELAKAAALDAVDKILKKGSDLQAWGLPVALSIGHKTRLRYANLYRLSGMPTDLGIALHDLLAPKIAADPLFLSKLTNSQLHEALQMLVDSLKYTFDARTPDGAKKMRLNGTSEGYDYPKARMSLVRLAQKKLVETPLDGDETAGLTPLASEHQPSVVLKKILTDTFAEFKSKSKSGAPSRELAEMENLLIALHAAMGLPVQTSKGMSIVPVQHRQLLPILAELRRRNVHDETVRAVIRTFPLGESILRLGVDKLWARGITGKGVKVAVIDNGIDFDHPEFSDIQDPISLNFTRDSGVHTKGGHGTPMASIVHAIAPDAELQSYQVLSNAESSDGNDLPGIALSGSEINAALLKAMDRAKANGAQIISMSLGAPMSYSNDVMARKIAQFAKEGILVVVSAGNSGNSMPKGFQVGSPGTAPDAITIGAVDYHGKKADFSSEGVVFNPTEHSAAEKPDFYAYGVNTKAAAQLPLRLYAKEPVPYTPVSGTSPATPHISSVLALMLQAGRDAGQVVPANLLVGVAREALSAAVTRIERLPVVTSAVKAVQAFVDYRPTGGEAPQPQA